MNTEIRDIGAVAQSAQAAYAYELQRENLGLRKRIAELHAARPTPSRIVEWIAALLGVTGGLLLSTNFHPAWGVAWFLASNVFWITYALQGRLWGMLAQQVLFTGTSLCGLWVWWLAPLTGRTFLSMLWSIWPWALSAAFALAAIGFMALCVVASRADDALEGAGL
jgi:FtsH-binding integral membrane protein